MIDSSHQKIYIYHKILKVILKSFIRHQISGIIWKLKYPSGNIHTIQFVFPLALCIVNMKGAHALCGMFDSYSNISRPCVSCDCQENDLDNPYVKCSDILDVKMKKIYYLIRKVS